ncbi:MAG: MotA/TolQ/ExbB proton channel family protein [Planctomycetota bacterium]|jgi:biopolymer transport protein ExbB
MLNKKIRAVSRRGWFLLAVIAVTLLIHASTGSGASVPDEPASTAEPYEISLWSTIASGGVIGLLIILVSLAAVALIVENLLTIRRDRMVPAYLVEEIEGHIQAREYEPAQEACTQDGSFLAQVVGAGLGQIGAMFGFFDMQNAMQEVSEREISKLYRKLEYLSFIASTSPMLGLLGTVTGMISAFNQIAQTEGAARPSQLAGGISEALVTTCLGLVVAIPTLFFVAFFRRRIDGFVAESEIVVEKLMGHFRKGPQK